VFHVKHFSLLQSLYGTFYGKANNVNMIRFDQSGNTIWSVPGDSPQIATADGGVIGSSGITYDNNGRATGQVSLPIQSWTGYAYTDGPVDQVVLPATAMASTFAVWPWGVNNTATPQQDFPPLPSCFDFTLNPPISCPGPREEIYEALADLITRLQSTTIVAHDANNNPLTLSALAQSQVFKKLGGGLSTGGLINYLTNQTPLFYNGLTSSYCEGSLSGGPSCTWLTSLLLQTVSKWFASDTGREAESDTPHTPLRTFFRPSSILYNNGGKNLGNESTIFYEALHGWANLSDLTLLEKFYGDNGGKMHICQGAAYIADYVLKLSPGLDQTDSPCD